jgi:hypothetical protein
MTFVEGTLKTGFLRETRFHLRKNKTMKQLDHAAIIAQELNITPQQVEAAMKLLDEGAPCPLSPVP